MTKHLTNLRWAVIVLLFFTSCASRYHVINPATLNYQSKSAEDNVVVEYQTNLLTGKYAQREIKSDVYLIAVKVTNNTGRDIIFRNNLKIFSGDKEVTPIPLSTFYTATQQNPDKSLLFLFLTPLNVYTFSQTTNGNQVTSQKNRFYPVGILIGPPLAFGNMATAKKANRNLKKELDENDISERIILSGHTEYGLIAIRDVSPANLSFKTNF